MFVQLVAPKRKRLAEAESLLAQQMSHLNEKRGELKEVMDKLQNLNDDYRSKVNKKRVRVITLNYSSKYRYRVKSIEEFTNMNTLTHGITKFWPVVTDRARQELLFNIYSIFSINLPVFYHEGRSLIGYDTDYLFCDR